MRADARFLAGSVAILLLSVGPAIAITNGESDGNAHPAIAKIVGTKGDPCLYFDQSIGCSAVLVAPNVVISLGDCTAGLADALASGFIDQAWVDFNPSPLIFNDVEPKLNCLDLVPVTSIVTNPSFLNPPFVGEVGVMILGSSQTIAPATLPVANRLKNLPKGKTLTAVSYGYNIDPNSPPTPVVDPASLARRFGTGRTNPPISAEFQPFTLDSAGGTLDPCMGGLDDGGAAYVQDTNEIVSLILSGAGCVTSGNFQRLDVPSVRDFLASYVTLP